jgi:hypothetical protein
VGDVLWIAAVIAVGLITAVAVLRRVRRRRFFARYEFPAELTARLQQRLRDPASVWRVLLGLRTWFRVLMRADGEDIAMPSKLVDEAWHEFLLFTREYAEFCQRAFGRFLHHQPAAGPVSRGRGAAWWFSCAEAGIDPRRPTRLPLLFAIDAELGVENGCHYDLATQAAMARASYGAAMSGGCSTGGEGDVGWGDAGHHGGDGGASCSGDHGGH